MMVTEVHTHFVISGFDDPGSAVGDNALNTLCWNVIY
jgi:hypothetical protein